MLKNRNIRVLFAISFLQGMVFYASIATLYRRAAGVSVFQITCIESVSFLLSLALEVPWGIAADRIGCRRTLIFCNALFAVSKVIFWQADCFAHFLFERILLSVVTAGTSGVTESLLASSCSKEDAHRVYGWNSALGNAGLMLASLAYSLFIGADYRLAALLTVISYAIAAFLSFFLRDTPVSSERTVETAVSLRVLFRKMMHTSGLLPLVLCGALFGESVQLITVFLNQLQYERCRIDARWMGAVHMAGTAVWLFSAASASCAKWLGRRRLGITALASAAAACAVMAFSQSGWLAILCVLILCLCGALAEPMLEEMKIRLTDAENRATTLSMTALFANSAAVMIELPVGRLADHTLSGAMLLCAALCVAALGLFARIVSE